MDIKFLIVTKFFADMFFILKKIILIFQFNYISLSEIRLQLIITYKSITANFIRSVDISLKYNIHFRKLMEELKLQSKDLSG